jgi:hypothetical protein
MAIDEGLTPEEQQTADLVDALKKTGNLHPLIEVLRGPSVPAMRFSCSANSTCNCSSRWRSTR